MLSIKRVIPSICVYVPNLERNYMDNSGRSGERPVSVFHSLRYVMSGLYYS
jgi:hypothetical protein